MLTTEKDVVPIKTFVHKVLSRSRTTCSVLQSALCYIEAVRSRVPELVELERSDKGIRGEPDLTSRITKASDELSIDSLIDTDKYSSSLPTELMNTTIMDPSSQGTTLCPTDVVLEPCETAPMSCADLAESATKHMKRPFPTLLALPPFRHLFSAHAGLSLQLSSLLLNFYRTDAIRIELGRSYQASLHEKSVDVNAHSVMPCSELSNRSVMRSRTEPSISLSGPSVGQNAGRAQPLSYSPSSDVAASPEFGKNAPPRRSPLSLKRAATLRDETQMRTAYVVPKAQLPCPSATTAFCVIPARPGERSLFARSEQLLTIYSFFRYRCYDLPSGWSIIPIRTNSYTKIIVHAAVYAYEASFCD